MSATIRDDRPRLVCFDLGGVVVRICRSWAEGCAAAGLPVHGAAERERTRSDRQEAVLAYQTGRIDGPAFARKISAILDGAYTPKEIMDVHRAWIIGAYPGMDTLIDGIHAAGLETGVLSNTNAEHWSALEGIGAFTRLHNRHASHLLGLHKPDPAIYRAFEAATGFGADDIVFFDDLPENVEGARSAGWRAMPIDPLGDPASQVRGHLAALGLALG
ncbi:MAG: HAD-IA family hydrolase [Phycisphaerales bacterium]|nr:HAD-IA family hydrolase [Phycisphaerales bacterium]